MIIMVEPELTGKVVILGEKDYGKENVLPPNFFSWFIWEQMWDKLPQKDPGFLVSNI